MSNVIELKNVDKSYTNSGFLKKTTCAHILKNISLQVEKGTTLGLVGESGSGKTTTTRMILRQEKPTNGELFYEGRNVEELTKEEEEEYRNNVQVVFQNPYSSLNPKMRVGEIIAEPLVITGKYNKEEIKKRVRSIMEKVGLAQDYVERFPSEFSGGQRQRIAIARALIQNPQLVILDEPVSALDVSVRGQIMNLLKRLQEKNKTTYIFISHDIATVGFLSDTIAVMYFGTIVEYGKTEDILENYRHPYTEMLISSDSVRNLSEAEEESGEIPSHYDEPKGCPFAGRCKYATDECRNVTPQLKDIGDGHKVACHNAESITLKSVVKINRRKPEYQI